ncbi:MAG: ATP-binding protein [Gammaproteobacteria bacterium]
MVEESRNPGTKVVSGKASSPGSSAAGARRESRGDREALEARARRVPPAMSYEDLSRAIAKSLNAFDAVDENGLFVYVNEAYVNLWGYDSADEIIGTSPASHCADATMPGRIIAEVSEKGSGDFYFDALRKDGSTFKCHMRVSVLDRPDGSRIYHGFSQDITELVAAEAELAKSRDRLKAAASAGVIGVWDWDILANDLYWDDVMYRLYGGSADDYHCAYDAWFATLHPDDQPVVAAAVDAALRKGTQYASEFRIVLPSGAMRYIQAKARVECDDDGRPVRMIGVNYDITEQKTASAAAEAASRAKSRFLATMSHELRTPMNGVLGMAHLLRRGATEQQLRRLDTLEASGRHMVALINDILDLAKIDEDRLQLHETAVDVREVVQEAIQGVSEEARAKGLALRVELPEQLPPVRVDATRLRQGLFNYLSNAVKFTESGSIVARVTCEILANGDRRLRFEVEDTGCGISLDDQGRLFQRFQQIDDSATRMFGGSGLGLAITRELARLMGGDVGVESTPGVGSMFWFTVVAQPAAQSSLPAEQSISDAEERLRALHAGRRILVAEDDPINQKLIEELLAVANLEVDIVENGQAALDRVAKDSYDLVLMDMLMPGMGGLEAARRIRALPDMDSLPIIAFTANVLPEQRSRYLAEGVNDVLEKPVDVAALYATIRYWLDAGKDRAGTSSSVR